MLKTSFTRREVELYRDAGLDEEADEMEGRIERAKQASREAMTMPVELLTEEHVELLTARQMRRLLSRCWTELRKRREILFGAKLTTKTRTKAQLQEELVDAIRCLKARA